jgi:hypothetical protein
MIANFLPVTKRCSAASVLSSAAGATEPFSISLDVFSLLKDVVAVACSVCSMLSVGVRETSASTMYREEDEELTRIRNNWLDSCDFKLSPLLGPGADATRVGGLESIAEMQVPASRLFADHEKKHA